MPMHDPFAIPDTGFEPYSGPSDRDEFSQPDLTPISIKEFLCSQQGQKEFERLVPPQPSQPAPAPSLGRVLGYIPGYPR